MPLSVKVLEEYLLTLICSKRKSGRGTKSRKKRWKDRKVGRKKRKETGRKIEENKNEKGRTNEKSKRKTNKFYRKPLQKEEGRDFTACLYINRWK